MIVRTMVVVTIALTTAASSLLAQSSQFGVRGLGQPGRGLSVDALGTEGAMGMFSPSSVLNPASLANLTGSMVTFTTAQEWRTASTPDGSGSARAQRFPLVMVGGPIPNSRFAVGVSFSNYTDRDFLLVSNGTASPRGVPIAVTDSLGSTGGLSDFRVATSYILRPGVQVGVGLHLITGSNRLFYNRAWADTSYRAVRQETELSYLGTGVSAGVMLQPSSDLELAGSIRYNAGLSVERDSLGGDRSIAMPLTVAGAVRWHTSSRLSLAARITANTWRRSDDQIGTIGGLESRNTIGIAAGMVWSHNRRHPAKLPLRLGVRRTGLPFLLREGRQPTELGVTIGTGIRFANGIGGIDVAVERVHRSAGGEFSEDAWHLSAGVSLRGIPGT